MDSKTPQYEFQLSTFQVKMLSFSLFALGACGIAYEYTLSKVASDILGHSSRQWAITIAVMMFFMGVGSEVQKYIPNRSVARRFFQFEVLLGLLGGVGPILLVYVFAHFPAYFATAHLVLISTIGLGIGLEIPLLVRIREQYEKTIQSNIGRVLLLDYFGSLVGALAWVFILPKFFTLVEMGAFLGVFNLLVALFTWVVFRPQLSTARIDFLSLILVAGLVLTTLFRGDQWATHAEQSLYQDRIIHSETSAIQHLVLTQSQRGLLALYLNGHLQFHQYDEHIYHEILVHSAMGIHPSPQRVLILGGGDGLAVREVLRYPGVESITLVDLDSAVTRLARSHPQLVELNQGSLNSPKVLIHHHLPELAERVPLTQPKYTAPRSSQVETSAQIHLYHLDAHRFVQLIPEKYDVMILDFPDPHHSELAKLYSREFYKLLQSRLLPGGIIIQQSSSPSFAAKAFASVGVSMREAGLEATPMKHNVPTFGPWGWWIARSSAAQMEAASGTGSSQLAWPRGETPQWPEDLRYLHAEMWPGLFIFGKNELNFQVESSRLSSPKIVDYYLEGWFQ